MENSLYITNNILNSIRKNWIFYIEIVNNMIKCILDNSIVFNENKKGVKTWSIGSKAMQYFEFLYKNH